MITKQARDAAALLTPSEFDELAEIARRPETIHSTVCLIVGDTITDLGREVLACREEKVA